jgi:hypothetical protein
MEIDGSRACTFADVGAWRAKYVWNSPARVVLVFMTSMRVFSTPLLWG